MAITSLNEATEVENTPTTTITNQDIINHSLPRGDKLASYAGAGTQEILDIIKILAATGIPCCLFVKAFFVSHTVVPGLICCTEGLRDARKSGDLIILHAQKAEFF
ncbi:hypothetical protein K469DRAFT_690226 [Zopfia rhizophila CBS 207.26]|uniref:Uncharacterized protein n=1 Tax=Zopfia rhizophila CBS 207.26 TaxID=1314779 RepID=A0A6A6DYR1_9PEZI|nr:hypothetical protein K469DRAFT_690226 [Zopfia rhizophila CBS 207.26]